MSQRGELIAELLVATQWGFGVLSANRVFCLRAEYQGTTYPVEIEVIEDSAYPTVTAKVFYLPQITSLSRQNLLEFVSAVNFHLRAGGLQIDDSPYLKFRDSFTLKDVRIDASFLDAFLMRVVRKAAKLQSAVTASLHGDLPGDAINLIQQ
jgi:hypothetical protein